MKKTIIVVFLFLPFIISGQSFLFGDWGGTRTSLSEAGFDFEFIYTGEYFAVFEHNLDDGTVYLANFDITAAFDFEKIIGWNGATGFAYILGNHGGIPNKRVGTIGRGGALQGVSNIATHSTWKLYEFWVEQQLFNERFSLLFGLYDLNSEFDVQETSGIFINPSHGIGPDYSQSGENGPSIFSVTSLAIRLKYRPIENLYALLGVFDGVSGDPNNPNGTHIIFGKNDGLLIPIELGLFENGEDFQAGFGKYSIGGWFYSADFEDLTEVDDGGNPILRNNNFGLYLSAEKFLFSEANDPTQGLAAFLRFGIANSDINGLEHYWGSGINITGLIRGRDEDVIGLAIGTARASKKLMLINEEAGLTTDKNEMIIEFTYMFQATPWLRIQPDFQYVINPLGAYINDKATVAGVRVEVAL